MNHSKTALFSLLGALLLLPVTSFASGRPATPAAQEAQVLEKKERYREAKTIRTQSNRHVSTKSEEDKARQQRILQLTRNGNTGSNRVKSAKINFKKNLGNTTGATRFSTQDTDNTTSEKALSRAERFRAVIARNRERHSARTQGTTTNTERRSSFEFIPQEGQIWGR